MIFRQFSGHGTPHVSGVGVTVQEHDGRAGAAEAHENLRAVGGSDHTGFEARGERNNTSLRHQDAPKGASSQRAANHTGDPEDGMCFHD
jgi:hypothetical protein